MTYNDLSSAEIVTLQAFAAVLGIRLEQINWTLGFTDDRNHNIVFRRDITRELITLIIETEETNGESAWENIDLDNAGDSRYWYSL